MIADVIPDIKQPRGMELMFRTIVEYIDRAEIREGLVGLLVVMGRRHASIWDQAW